jgi:chemotaxis response regulator CheB
VIFSGVSCAQGKPLEERVSPIPLTRTALDLIRDDSLTALQKKNNANDERITARITAAQAEGSKAARNLERTVAINTATPAKAMAHNKAFKIIIPNSSSHGPSLVKIVIKESVSHLRLLPPVGSGLPDSKKNPK